MNRQQRRNMVNNPALLQHVIKAKCEEVSNNSVTMLCAVLALELHDKHGWGKKRINTLLSDMLTQVDCINGGYAKLEEIINECRKIGVINERL